MKLNSTSGEDSWKEWVEVPMKKVWEKDKIPKTLRGALIRSPTWTDEIAND